MPLPGCKLHRTKRKFHQVKTDFWQASNKGKPDAKRMTTTPKDAGHPGVVVFVTGACEPTDGRLTGFALLKELESQEKHFGHSA